jgi:hydrogenase nickel incorporation protein HypA/HybF
MHEIRIAEDLSGIVLATAGEENLQNVTRVNIVFGEMIQIVPMIFEFAVAENAELNLEIVPVKMKCSECGSGFRVSDNLFACNICGSTDLEIINGKELFIKSIEGE